MDVWMTWCRKKSACHYCPEPILKATPMVKGKLWRKRGGEKRTWTIMFRWHPQCWIAEAMAYLDKNPYSPVKTAGVSRGRPPLKMSKEDRTKRTAILRRRASFIQRIRAAVYEAKWDSVIILYDKMLKLNAEIEPLGGVPKDWTIK